jgi:SAM-dependent methyltransferase
MGRSAALVEAWRQEERTPLVGWDFAHLHGRMVEQPTPWSYEELAAGRLAGSGTALDMDTGGGERFAALSRHWPRRVVATEGYTPNVRVAAERLWPLGAAVVPVASAEDAAMPFLDGTFGLVLNRHGAFNADEVARVLRPGGVFLSQQVHGMFAADLLAAFGASPPWPDASPERYLPRLARAGLEVGPVEDWTGRLVFTDVGAVVYYLASIPWLVPDFSVDRHEHALWRFQERLDAEGQLAFSDRKYLLQAAKPDAGSER